MGKTSPISHGGEYVTTLSCDLVNQQVIFILSKYVKNI